jgi:hypothetical protein
MCVPKIIGGALGGLAAGGPVGALAGGLAGRALFGGKKKAGAVDPAMNTDAYTSALAQGVGRKKALRTALVVNARNQLAAAGKPY